MRQDKDRTEITDDYVIKHFECDKCGSRMKKKTKKWRKPRLEKRERR